MNEIIKSVGLYAAGIYSILKLLEKDMIGVPVNEITSLTDNKDEILKIIEKLELKGYIENSKGILKTIK